MTQAAQAPTENPRAVALQKLRAAGISYEATIGRAQVMIRRQARTFEFWPTTGRWRERDMALHKGMIAHHRPSRQAGSGVETLIAAVGARA